MNIRIKLTIIEVMDMIEEHYRECYDIDAKGVGLLQFDENDKFESVEITWRVEDEV